MLRRLLTYAEKVYGLRDQIKKIRDNRKRPRMEGWTVFASGLVMMLMRMGSLNAQEETKRNPFWRKWTGSGLASADTTGRVFAGIKVENIRAINRHIYSRQKRNKALGGNIQGLRMLIIDGHEQHASYLCRCAGCCERKIGEGEKQKVQYYHRNVTAMLVCGEQEILLDSEMQKKGEDEVSCAMRLLERVLKEYNRAFDVVIGDGLYLQGRFFEYLVKHGKEAVAVLKDERRDLMKDAMGLFDTVKAEEKKTKNMCQKMWDIEGFTSWEGFGKPVRVVRSLETKKVRRQKSRTEEETVSDWIWATTLLKFTASTETIIKIGHKRWAIENEGFNELVNQWHADHIYKHDPNAIEIFWQTLILAYNLFHAFITLNLKPEIRIGRSYKYWAAIIASDLYAMEFVSCSDPPWT